MIWGEKLKQRYTNTEKEAIEFLQSIGYQFDTKEKRFFPSKKEIAEKYSLDFLKEHLSYNDMLMQEPLEKDIIDTFFHYLDFLYAVQKYGKNTTKINNHGAYIITLLYNAKAQNEADITNQVQHDMYGSKN